MTNQEQLQKIREKCIESNPEIVELKFGCELKHNSTKNIWKATGKHSWSDGVAIVLTDKGIVQWEKDTYEIIGRPIRLVDVLLAIKSIDYVIMFDGTFLDKYDLETGAKWNLLKDNLTLQNEETIRFIYELLHD